MNPYCDCRHMNRNHAEEGYGKCTVPGCTCAQFHNNQLQIDETPVETDPLVLKAKDELGRLQMNRLREQNPDFDDKILEIIRIYQSIDVSGTKHTDSVKRDVAQMIFRLLKAEPLSQLTNDPSEWQVHTPPEGVGGLEMWQSKRDPRMFSYDRGHTYWDPTKQEMSERQVTASTFEPEYDR